MTSQGAGVSPMDPGSHLSLSHAHVRTQQRTGVNFRSGVSSEELKSQHGLCVPLLMPMAPSAWLSLHHV